MSQVVRLTISLPRDMISFADKVAGERKISRSKVISLCLQEVACPKTQNGADGRGL